MTNMPGWDQIFEGFRAAQTEKLQYDAEFGALSRLPATPNGREVYRFKVGQTVTCTARGTLRQGFSFQITAREKANGFCRYYGGGMWHRNCDLQAA